MGQDNGEKKKGLLSAIGAMFQKIGNFVNAIKNKSTKQILDAEKVAYDTIVDAEKVVYNTIVEAENVAYDTIVEAEKVVYDTIVEAEKVVYNTIVEAEKVVYDTIVEAEKFADAIIEKEVEGLFEPDAPNSADSVKTDL